MTFLQPWWLLLSLLAIPLLLWHARNPRSIPVPSLRIWRTIAPDAMPDVSKRRFTWRFDASLWLQVLALLALTIAMAGPRPAGIAVDHQIWLVDLSRSMGAAGGTASDRASPGEAAEQGPAAAEPDSADPAEDERVPLAADPATTGFVEFEPGRTSWEEAVDWAVAALSHADSASRGGPEQSVIGISGDPRVLLARSDDPAAAALAMEASEVAADGRPLNLSRARAILTGLIREGERTRVTLLTDAPGTSGAKEVLQPWLDEGVVQVEVATFGEASPTHGFSSLRVGKVEGSDNKWLIEGEVRSYLPTRDLTKIEPLTLLASFEREGVQGKLPWDELNVRPRAEVTPFSFEAEFPGPGTLTLELPPDALPADDTARVVLRDEPVPLKVVVAGSVPQGLVDAFSVIDDVEIVMSETPASGEFDLALVGPGVRLLERPAPTVLWLKGIRPSGAQGARLRPPAELWAGNGNALWTGVRDVVPADIEEAFALPDTGDAVVLLHSDSGPLLQVSSGPNSTDVWAAWGIGDGAWTRELGFARLVSELAGAAEPRYGAWIEPRCLIGQPCRAATSEAAPQPGVHEDEEGSWTVDVDAGPEIDLLAEAVEFGRVAQGTNPWSRLDRALALLAALLLAVETVRAWRRRRLTRREVNPLSFWASIACRGIGVAALLLLALGTPSPAVRLLERVVLAIDPAVVSGDGFGTADREALLSDVRRSDGVVWADELGKLITPAAAADRLNSSDTVSSGYDLQAVVGLGAAALGPDGGRVIAVGVHGEEAHTGRDQQPAWLTPGVTVDVLPPPARGEGGVRLTALEAPVVVRAGETVEIRVRISGVGEAGTVPGKVEVTVDEEPLERSGSGVAIYEWQAGAPGTYEVRASIVGREEPGEALVEMINVVPAARVALVTSGESEPGAVAELLEDHFEVETWAPTEIPTTVDGFLGFDVVALLDVPAVEMHPVRQESLERWVREYGGGVLIAGAERSFGPGGYLRTPLEEVSPLSARVPGEQPQAAIAFVVDRSGSMQQTVEGISRLVFAKEATAEAVELLHPASQVALVLFDDIAHLLKPLGPKGDVGARLAPITAGGGTNLYPALQLAFEQLRETEAEAKHIIVISDGLAQAAPFGNLIPQITGADITISTVAVGRGADTALLEQIARSGGGAFHRSEDVRALPSILSQEAMLLSGNPLREGTIAPEFDPGRAVFLDNLPETFPDIAGYVRTTPKPEAEVHALTPNGDPLLASWRHGIGRVISLATPLEGEWGREWIDSEFARQMLDQGLRWLAAPVLQPGVNLSASREGDAIRVWAAVVGESGEAVEGARVVANAQSPDGWTIGPVLLNDLGRGFYAGNLDAFASGPYEVSATLPAADPEDKKMVGVYVASPSSLGPGTSRVAAASELAAASGGRLLLDAAGAGPRRELALDLTPRLAPWAWLAVIFVGLALTLDALQVHRSSGRGTGRKGSGRGAPGRAATGRAY